MISVTKECTFDAAHLLSGHDGLCKNLHGHTYKVLVTARYERYSNNLIPRGTSAGMVVDFKDLKKAIQEVITDRFDHAFIYHSEGLKGEIQIAELVRFLGMRFVEMAVRPTAENMALYFLDQFRYYFKQHDANRFISKVVVYETPTSYAEASVDY